MPAYVVLGAQWGDEGKGKIIDCLATDIRAVSGSRRKSPVPADIVVRFSGGNNAGHTVHNEMGEFKLHLVPAGIFSPTTLNVIGPGVVVDPRSFQEEFDAIREECGLSLQDFRKRLLVSKKAHLVFRWHILEDELQEKSRGGNAIGTTGRGIGPVFTDKTARFGLRVGDLLDEKDLRGKLARIWAAKSGLFRDFYNIDLYEKVGDLGDILNRLLEFRDNFASCFADVERTLQDAFDCGRHILFEGAQGFLLDVEHGTYPKVTSSRTGISAAYNCGITKFKEVIGVTKAYTTRVGAGPFPTEMEEERAERFRDIANEFGATTGRPRRIGWLDIPALRYFVRMNGVTGLALTKLDILDNFYVLHIGTGYKCLDHDECSRFECVVSGRAKEATLKSLYGWGGAPSYRPWAPSVAGAKSLGDFPSMAAHYCNRIQDKVAPIVLISTGPHRDETIVVKRTK